MNLRRRIILFITVISGISMLAILLGILTLRQLKNEFDTFMERNVALFASVKDTYALGLQRGQAVRNVILNPADRTAEENFNKASKDAIESLHILTGTARGENAKTAKAMLQLTQEDIALQTGIIAIAKSDQKKATEILNKTETPLWRSIKVQIFKMEKEVREDFNTEAESIAQLILYRNIISIALAILFLIVAGAMHLMFEKKIVEPIHDFIARVQDLSGGEGDLTVMLEVRSRDEVGQLAEHLNHFIESIRGMVTLIAQNAEKVLQVSHTISEASQKLSGGIENVSLQTKSISDSATAMNDNLESVAGSVEEMSISINEIAQKTSHAANEAKQADESSRRANGIVQELGRSADQINRVIEAIAAISDQTNLLALNASIEAAGAGDAGKGFAVVAGEVKELARRASESSEEVKRLIGIVQKNSGDTVQSIEDIGHIISEVRDTNASIAAMVEEQSVAAAEIAKNIQESTRAAEVVTGNISSISDSTEGGAKEAARTSELAILLERLSDELSTLVRRFKI